MILRAANADIEMKELLRDASLRSRSPYFRERLDELIIDPLPLRSAIGVTLAFWAMGRMQPKDRKPVFESQSLLSELQRRMRAKAS